MADVESILTDDEFFGDTVDTPKEGTEQHKKRKYLKSAIGNGKPYLLGGKKRWTHEKIDKSNDKTINKTHVEYKQHELNEKSEKTRRALGKHIIHLHSIGISQIIKIKDAKKITGRY